MSMSIWQQDCEMLAASRCVLCDLWRVAPCNSMHMSLCSRGCHPAPPFVKATAEGTAAVVASIVPDSDLDTM